MWKSVWFFSLAVNNGKKAGNSLWKSAGKEVDRNVDKKRESVDKWKTCIFIPRAFVLSPTPLPAVVDLLTALWLWSQPRA